MADSHAASSEKRKGFFGHFGVRFAKMAQNTKNLASIIRVFLYAFPDAPNSYITNGFSRFGESAKSHCRIVKNVMVLLTFLWSFCRIGVKRAHFPQCL